MAYLKVSVNFLRKGMVIVKDVYTKAGPPLVVAGTPVTKEVINLLTKHFVDTVMVEYVSDTSNLYSARQGIDSKVTEKEFKKFQEEFYVAEENIAQNLRAVVEGNKDIQVRVLLDNLNAIIERADGEANLITMLMRMKTASAGLYQHSMNVALFGQILAKWLQCSKEEIELIAIAGLLHDIGFVNLPKEKMKFFTFQDDLEVSDRGKHAIDGYNIIKNQNIDSRIKQAVLMHHEGLDGSGFPLQVSHFDINQISRIIAIADTYDILTMKEEGRRKREFVSFYSIAENGNMLL